VDHSSLWTGICIKVTFTLFNCFQKDRYDGISRPLIALLISTPIIKPPGLTALLLRPTNRKPQTANRVHIQSCLIANLEVSQPFRRSMSLTSLTDILISQAPMIFLSLRVSTYLPRTHRSTISLPTNQHL